MGLQMPCAVNRFKGQAQGKYLLNGEGSNGRICLRRVGGKARIYLDLRNFNRGRLPNYSRGN